MSSRLSMFCALMPKNCPMYSSFRWLLSSSLWLMSVSSMFASFSFFMVTDSLSFTVRSSLRATAMRLRCLMTYSSDKTSITASRLTTVTSSVSRRFSATDMSCTFLSMLLSSGDICQLRMRVPNFCAVSHASDM